MQFLACVIYYIDFDVRISFLNFRLVYFDEESNFCNSFFFQMNGRQLITMTLRYLDDFLVNLEQQTTQTLQHYDYIVPHQASKFGNEYFMQRYGLSDDQVVNTLSAYGNCVSASIPLGLYELYAQNKLQSGKDVLLIGTAAGLSIGALRLKF